MYCDRHEGLPPSMRCGKLAGHDDACVPDLALVEARLELAERAASTYHAWLRVLFRAAKRDGEALARFVLEAVAFAGHVDIAGAEKLIEQPWREAFGTEGPSAQQPISAFAINVGEALIAATPVLEAAIETAEMGDPAGYLATAVRAFGGGGSESSELGSRRMVQWRRMAEQWRRLVEALRPVVQAEQAGTLQHTWDQDSQEAARSHVAVLSGFAALEWFVGMELSPPMFVPSAPTPPQVLDAARASADAASLSMSRLDQPRGPRGPTEGHRSEVRILEIALDAALAEVRWQGGPEGLLEARSAGLDAARAFIPALVDQICFQLGQTHDTSELWGAMRRDPDAFRRAVRYALESCPRAAAPQEGRGA